MVTTDSFLLVGGRNRSNIIEDASIDDLESFALKQGEAQSPTEVQPKQPQDEHGAADGNTSANSEPQIKKKRKLKKQRSLSGKCRVHIACLQVHELLDIQQTILYKSLLID